ncbi:26S proteasome non-ATPase regulatory subunit 4 [Tanacetum coccineum]
MGAHTTPESVPLGGTLDFQHGIGFAQVGFLKRCPNGMRKRMLLFVGGPLNSSKADIEGLGRNEVKKERLEAFVAAVNNNNNTSHIAYLEHGCDVLQVLTESGILTRVTKDVSGLAPALFQFIDGRRR